MKHREKGIVITGASRGLGEALAFDLARRGARLVLVARGQTELDAVVHAIRNTGGEAHAWVADLGDKAAIYPLAGMAQATLGGVDMVIHSASALGPSPLRPLLDTDGEDLERALAVNLLGPFRLTKALAGPMALAGRGAVVHITSDASVSAYPTWGAYSVSKAALDHLTRVWAAELQDFGVRMVSVDPGDMNTAMHREAAPGDDPASLLDPEEVAERLADWLEHIETVPSGSRTVLSDWRRPRWTWGERMPVGARSLES
jgi:NAD(P)-dependent dehydrogenase (short-subunit alcohol dehydrogenase family)